jgi:hypothetical protein
MRRVLKFPLYLDRSTPVPGKVVLIAQWGHQSFPTVWVEVSDSPSTPDMVLTVYGIGIGTGEHVGSCVCNEFVWHVYKE